VLESLSVRPMRRTSRSSRSTAANASDHESVAMRKSSLYRQTRASDRIAPSWGSRARSEVARCDLREQQGKRKKSESGGKHDHPGALMVTDDRDQAGDDGGDPARPDT
jgi:hypothetical protein